VSEPAWEIILAYFVRKPKPATFITPHAVCFSCAY
jgi:hypothetical protein